MKTTFGRSVVSFGFAAAIQMVPVAIMIVPKANKNHEYINTK